MRYSRDKVINAAVEKLLKSGWFVKSSKRHLRLQHPETNQSITVPGSPSCSRAALNWLHQLKSQYGIELC